KITTRSGLGQTTPQGKVFASYGSFGTVNAGFAVAYGSNRWGNFTAANALNSGRFLDAPEFNVIHDRGNEENVFDRLDFQASQADSMHLNLQYTRSWFQTPNTFDNLSIFSGNPAGDTDERSKIGTFNIAPVWTHLISPSAVLTVGAFVRRDQYNYYPSPNPLADLGPINSETIAQDRKLTNAGFRTDISYVKGVHNLKAGVIFDHTFLHESDRFGIVDPNLIAGLTDADGNPLNCLDNGQPIQGTPCATLAPFDLTGGGGRFAPGGLFHFQGHTDIKELSLYAQDTIN